MPGPPPVERLSDRQYVVLLIRALVDPEDRLLSGEVGGPVDAGPERWVRFREPADLADAVQRWLSDRGSAR
ncbi:MAG: hypothetical protein JO020_27195 [Chloroflexi bacterium]|nr:hypothetical protein [Chloroflexota bacterium]MBV9133977.1 hypothetical protein [Chloroflexota bacterium]MBV9897860.1 hypothetical protein [Chloroflexota bacterium]